jgi:hypothetical protein
MLLHLNFCIDWFESNSKENSKSFWKMLWKIGKRKKGFPLLIGFGPALWPSLILLRSPAVRPRLLLTTRDPFPSPPLPAWAEPSQWPNARAPPSFLCSSLTPRACLLGTPSSSPRRRQISFLVHHRSNLPPISFPSLFRAPPAYISRVPHPSAISCTEAEDWRRLEEATLEMQP